MRSPAPAAYLIEHNRAARFLKAHGYRFVFFPSSWYSPTRKSSEADEQFELDTSFTVGRAIQRSEVAQYFARSTLFDVALPHLATSQDVHTADILRTFAGLAALPHGTQPVFGLAHILMPHVPYIADSLCRPLPPGARLYSRATPEGRAALAAELACLNRQVLQTVHALIAKSETPPVIILQGDHGTQSLRPFDEIGAVPTTEQARERFRAFGAYYLPDGGASAIPDSTSIVNVLRYVFSYYFHANLAPLPNRMYYSHWRRPYDLTEVDGEFQAVRGSDAAAQSDK